MKGETKILLNLIGLNCGKEETKVSQQWGMIMSNSVLLFHGDGSARVLKNGTVISLSVLVKRKLVVEV